MWCPCRYSTELTVPETGLLHVWVMGAVRPHIVDRIKLLHRDCMFMEYLQTAALSQAACSDESRSLLLNFPPVQYGRMK